MLKTERGVTCRVVLGLSKLVQQQASSKKRHILCLILCSLILEVTLAVLFFRKFLNPLKNFLGSFKTLNEQQQNEINT